MVERRTPTWRAARWRLPTPSPGAPDRHGPDHHHAGLSRHDQLDLTALFEVFARLPDAKVQIAWKKTWPAADAAGLSIVPSVTPKALPGDVLFVPGGPASWR